MTEWTNRRCVPARRKTYEMFAASWRRLPTRRTRSATALNTKTEITWLAYTQHGHLEQLPAAQGERCARRSRSSTAQGWRRDPSPAAATTSRPCSGMNLSIRCALAFPGGLGTGKRCSAKDDPARLPACQDTARSRPVLFSTWYERTAASSMGSKVGKETVIFDSDTAYK